MLNNLVVGGEIPSEIFLTEKLDVERNVAREALCRLRMLDIVESRIHNGMILREPSVIRCFSKVIYPYLLSKKQFLICLLQDLIGIRNI